jgi:uncharacterized protein (TIGR04255 family)
VTLPVPTAQCALRMRTDQPQCVNFGVKSRLRELNLGSAVEFQGQLPNAPLVSVLAAIQFPPILNVEKYIAVFQDLIRKEYPLVETTEIETTQVRVEGKVPEVVRATNKLWHFMDADRFWGVTLENAQMLLHTRAYTRFEDFASRFERLCDALAEAVAVTHYVKVSIRYVDVVRPQLGETISDYLPDHMFLRQIDSVAGQQIESFSASSFSTAEGTLAIRCWLNPQHAFPPDLLPLFRVLGMELASPKNDFAILDTDHVSIDDVAKPFELQTIIQRLDHLHFSCHRAFEGIPKPHAFKVWGLESSK